MPRAPFDFLPRDQAITGEYYLLRASLITLHMIHLLLDLRVLLAEGAFWLSARWLNYYWRVLLAEGASWLPAMWLNCYWKVLLRYLGPFRDRCHCIRQGKIIKGVLLQHDNVKVHNSRLAVDAIKPNGAEVFRHPFNSTDLAPNDIFASQTSKRRTLWTSPPVRGFPPESRPGNAVRITSYFLPGRTFGLKQRWTKCIEFNGNYVEKGWVMSLTCRLYFG